MKISVLMAHLFIYMQQFGDEEVVVETWDNRTVDSVVRGEDCCILETEEDEGQN